MSGKYPPVIVAGLAVAAGLAATFYVVGAPALVGIGIGLFAFIAAAVALIAA